MAIKKGIVVLDGTTETHKFLDDGSGQLGNPEIQGEVGAESPIILSGSVFVEGVSNDLVTELSTRRSSQVSYAAETVQNQATLSTQLSTSRSAMEDTASTEFTSLTAKINQEIAAQATERADFDTQLGQLSSTLSTRWSLAEDSLSTQTSTRISHYDSIQTRHTAILGTIDDMKQHASGSSGLFFEDSTYTRAVTGMVQYALDMDSASDMAANNAIGALDNAVQQEEIDRGDKDLLQSTALSVMISNRVSLHSSLQTDLTNLEQLADDQVNSEFGRIQSISDDLVSFTTDIDTVDSSLSGRLSDVSGEGEVSTRLSADSSIQDDIDAATKTQTEAYQSLTDRLSVQTDARAANVTALGTQKTNETTTREAEQTAAENLIITEETLQAASGSAASASLTARLASELASATVDTDATSAAISSESSSRVSGDESLSTILSTQVAAYEGSLASLTTRLGDQTTNRGAMRDSIVTRLTADQTTINDMLAGVSFDGNLSAMIDFIDGVDTASDAAVVAAVNSLITSLSTQTSLREDGDTSVQALIASETGTRVMTNNIFTAALGQKETAHAGNRQVAMKNATDTMFSEVDSETVQPIITAAAAAITAENAAMAAQDTIVSGEVTAESGTDRPSAIVSLQTARAGDASSGDISLQTRITDLATTLPTGELTLAGTLDGASNVTVDGTMQIGRLAIADIPLSYLASDDAHKGKMFYLDAPAGSQYESLALANFDPMTQEMEMKTFLSIFPEPQKWYFYEAGTWHPMPFYHDADGDGVRDQLDDLPNDPTETIDMDGDGVGQNADYDDNDPNVQTAPSATAATVEALMDHDGYGSEISFEILNITDGTVEFSHVGQDGASPADYVSLNMTDLVQGKVYKYSVADIGTWSDGTNYGEDAVNPTIKLAGGVSSTNFGHDNGAGTMGIGIGNYSNPADPGNGTQFVYVMFDGTDLIWGTTLNGAQDTITDGQSV